ncbi:hypothetical protein RIF23_02975 [Lipingzhangella sp. LS1_29]|uniref:Protein kinase domain-containing protein n=1 Tax=Lipingzhangella rawalii TaxID=2055835 RepID=A0ABU2H1T7_9ACTN|nr:hypothetical protein [Lipingzhangella rawalii]MDS1269256.1 hypothetical protein [Lipingzhangella rawalii]
MFAWGALVALAATGHDPFGSGTATELRERVRDGHADLEGVPADLASLVAAALSVDPGQRPHAAQLLEHILPAPPADTTAPQPDVENFGSSARTRLALFLAEHWRGFSAAGHDPALWAAATGSAVTAGAAGLAGAATLPAMGGAPATAGGAGSATITGGGISAASMTGGGAGAGGTIPAASLTGAGATASSGMGTGTIAAISAGAIVVTAAAGGGGYLAYEQLRDPTPQEAVEQAIEMVTTAQSIEAERTWEVGAQRAAELYGDTHDPETMIALSQQTYTHSYTSTPEPRFATAVSGDGAVGGYLHVDGQLLYENPEDPLDGYREVGASDGAQPLDHPTNLENPTTHTPRSLTTELRAIAESPAVTDAEDFDDSDSNNDTAAGQETWLLSGTFDHEALVTVDEPSLQGEIQQELRSEEAEFELWLSVEDAQPVQLEYSSPSERVTLEFLELNGSVSIDAPDADDIIVARCAEPFPGPAGDLYLDPVTPGLDCAEARRVLDGYYENPSGEVRGSSGRGTFEDWFCSWTPESQVTPAAADYVGSCSRADGVADGLSAAQSIAPEDFEETFELYTEPR